MNVLRRENIVQNREKKMINLHLYIYTHLYRLQLRNDYNKIKRIITKNKELKKNYNMTDVAIYRFSPTGVLRGRHIHTHTHLNIQMKSLRRYIKKLVYWTIKLDMSNDFSRFQNLCKNGLNDKWILHIFIYILKISYMVYYITEVAKWLITNDFKVDIVRINFWRLIGQRNAMSHFDNAQINKIIIIRF